MDKPEFTQTNDGGIRQLKCHPYIANLFDSGFAIGLDFAGNKHEYIVTRMGQQFLIDHHVLSHDQETPAVGPVRRRTNNLMDIRQFRTVYGDLSELLHSVESTSVDAPEIRVILAQCFLDTLRVYNGSGIYCNIADLGDPFDQLVSSSNGLQSICLKQNEKTSNESSTKSTRIYTIWAKIDAAGLIRVGGKTNPFGTVLKKAAFNFYGGNFTWYLSCDGAENAHEVIRNLVTDGIPLEQDSENSYKGRFTLD